MVQIEKYMNRCVWVCHFMFWLVAQMKKHNQIEKMNQCLWMCHLRCYIMFQLVAQMKKYDHQFMYHPATFVYIVNSI